MAKKRCFKRYEYDNKDFSNCKDFTNGDIITNIGNTGHKIICIGASECQNYDSKLCYRKLTKEEKKQ